MRIDSRRPDELRPVRVVPHYTSYAEGSVLIEFGLTRVICNATVEDGTPRWIQASGKPGGWVTGEYSMLPRATEKRTPRETSGPNGRTQEIRRLIGRSLRTGVSLPDLGSRTITLDCDVIQADGGTRTASITGGYIALAIALEKLIRQGIISPETRRAAVAAVSVGMVDGEPLLDLCYQEDSRAEVDANVVMNGQGDFIEVQFTAEGRPFSRNRLDHLLSLAEHGIRQLLDIQTRAIDDAFHA